MNSKFKVMTVVGTRPEVIRLSRVMAKLDRYTQHVLVHTGQNYDYELNEIFFTELDLRRPDFFWKQWGERCPDNWKFHCTSRSGACAGATGCRAGAR